MFAWWERTQAAQASSHPPFPGATHRRHFLWRCSAVRAVMRTAPHTHEASQCVKRSEVGVVEVCEDKKPGRGTGWVRGLV